MKNVLKDKSYNFALEIIKLSKNIQSKNEFVLGRQLMRSGTAIGALIREAEFGQSKKDFINKMSIALKEANESLYWLDLLNDSNLIDNIIYEKLKPINLELIAMLVSSIKTAKASLNSK